MSLHTLSPAARGEPEMAPNAHIDSNKYLLIPLFMFDVAAI